MPTYLPLHPLLLLLLLLAAFSPPSLLTKAGWVDPDSPHSVQRTHSLRDPNLPSLRLVMSDEFNVAARTFADGHDPTWTAGDHSDDARTSVGKGALIYYNHSYASTTEEGHLKITTTSELTQWKGFNPFTQEYEIFEKEFRGAMVNTWNKFCFSGGVVEASLKLPGPSDVGGLWPAFWLMGNLGRATYEHSTNLMWPWSFDVCDRKKQEAQEISACDRTTHWDLQQNQGRGATEIDIMEAMSGKPHKVTKKGDLGVGVPYMSSTLQVSPGVEKNRPQAGKNFTEHQEEWTWYDGLRFGEKSKMNMYFYGTLLDKTQKDEPAGRSIHQVYQADAVSALTSLSATHWEDFHTYRLEWMPGPEGYLAWYLDGEMLYDVPASALSNVTGAQIPVEPSYVILNTAVSTTWGFPETCPAGCACTCFDCAKPECQCGLPEGLCESLPASMLVDYVRIYQLEDDERHFLGCNHPKFPTRKFIQAHRWRYQRDHEKVPLKPVHRGQGKCANDADCNPGGSCNRRRKCVCHDGWTGPHCKQKDYHDDNVRGRVFLHFQLPGRFPASLVAALSTLGAVLIGAVLVWGRAREREEEEERRREEETQEQIGR